MGLFDAFTTEGKLKKNVRRMSDRDAQPEDRDASARWLLDEGSPRALLGLLTRFDLNLSNAMKDRTEKDAVYGMLRPLGKDKLADPVRAWMKRSKQYAWPLRLLVEVEGEPAAVAVVLDLLGGDVGKATFEPERRKELLVWLTEHRQEGVAARIAPFLKDFDEEVRYAAAEAMIAQDDEAAREPLLALLGDPKEESIRLKHRVARAFQARRWPVGDLGAGAEMPDGFAVQDGRVVSL